MSAVKALVLTDVVDSTRLAEALGDAAAATLWTAHDRLARDLLPAWRGREIDKTDGMLLLFDTAADAAGYALAYQRALVTLDPPLRARAGMHVGSVVLRENSRADVALGAKPLEVDGAAKSIVARVMSVATGGQILMSAPACQALGATSAPMQSHGHWRLQGLTDPIELYEIGDIGTPFTPPPDVAKAYRVFRQGELWMPARAIKHTLPAERDSFVGRDLALLDLSQRLRSGSRLVSVLGLGGIGKTRLVTRFGWSWLGEFPGGVWFCDLSQARDLDGIVYAVAQGLDVPLGPSEPLTLLGHAIAGRGACLVILDNFEQVARHADTTLGRWLDRAREARFLVTSREVLGLVGEEAMALTPLPAREAASLFLQRAEAAKSGFAPVGADREAIKPLVELLEGLPLAIELAAARVRVMSPRALLQRMGERFQLLSLGSGRIDRQATLRAVFDWSWDLLTPPEQAALAQLSVFEGGFTLKAAEAVVDLSGFAHTLWPVDALQSLVQKSFVRQVRDERFDLLVSVQEYASEHLRTPGRYAGSGGAAALQAQCRHGAYFGSLDDTQATADSYADLENLVVGCRRAVNRADADMATTLLKGAWAGLRQHGPVHTGVELASQVLGLPALGPEYRTQAHYVAGDALQASGRDAESHRHCELCLEAARGARDRQTEAQVLCKLGDLDMRAGHLDSARKQLAAAMAIARELGDRKLQSDVHNILGNVDECLGRLDAAHVQYQSALAWARNAGDRHREGGILGNLALLYADQGEMDLALSHHEAALAAARETGSLRLAGIALCNLGMVLQLLGRPAEARTRLDESLSAARLLGHPELECNVLCNLGIVFESLALPTDARVQFEAALALARTLGEPRAQGQFLGYLGLLHSRQSRHEEARRCLVEGQALLEGALDRINVGVLLCSRAEAEHRAGNSAAARQVFATAQSIGIKAGAGPASEIGLSLARVRALLDLP